MWKRRIELIRRILRLFQDFLGVNLLIALLLAALTNEHPLVVIPAVLSVLFLFSAAVRERVVRNLWILVWHLVPVPILLLLPLSWPLRLMFLAAVLGQMLPRSIAYSTFGGRLMPMDGTPWPMFLLTLIGYIGGSKLPEPALVSWSYITLFLGLFSYLILVYVEGISGYMDATKDVAGLPLKNILSVNSYIVGMILLILLLISVLTGFFHVEEALHVIARAGIAVLRVIGYFFKYAFIILQMLTSTTKHRPEEAVQETENVKEEIKHALASGEIFIKLFLLGIIIWIMVKTGGRILKWFIMRRRRDTSYVIEYSATPREGRRERAKKRGIFRGGDNREKARRAYRERIRRHSSYFPLRNSMTCGEIRDELLEKELDDVEELTALYERIRYTEEPVDKVLLKQMRRLSND